MIRELYSRPLVVFGFLNSFSRNVELLLVNFGQMCLKMADAAHQPQARDLRVWSCEKIQLVLLLLISSVLLFQNSVVFINLDLNLINLVKKLFFTAPNTAADFVTCKKCPSPMHTLPMLVQNLFRFPTQITREKSDFKEFQYSQIEYSRSVRW